MAASMVARWAAYSIDDLQCAALNLFPLGGFAGRYGSAAPYGGLEWRKRAWRRAGSRTHQCMLRKLASRREVLCLPGLARRAVGDLVDAWAAGLDGKVVSVHRRPV